MIFLISSLHLRLWDALFTLIYIGHSQSAIRWIADFPHYSILISDVMCGPSGLDFSNGSRHCALSFRIPFFYHFASLSIPFLHLVLQRWGDIVETLSNTLGMLRCCTSHVCVCSFPIKAHNQWCTYLQICIYIYTYISLYRFMIHDDIMIISQNEGKWYDLYDNDADGPWTNTNSTKAFTINILYMLGPWY